MFGIFYYIYCTGFASSSQGLEQYITEVGPRHDAGGNKPPPPPDLASVAGTLFDTYGLKVRYTTLSVGTFVFSLGLSVPYYYIGEYC